MKRFLSLIIVLASMNFINIFDQSSVYYGYETQNYQDLVMGEAMYLDVINAF